MTATDGDPLEPTPREGGRSGHSLEHWILLGGAIVGVLGLVVLGFFVSPDERGHGTHERLGLPPCLPMKLWGVPCPGCGVTTSITHAAHGDLTASMATQPFGFLLFLAIPIYAVWAVTVHLRGRDLGDVLGRLRLGLWVLWPVGAMLAAWIYKLVRT